MSCAVIAPIFPTGIQGPNDFDSYISVNAKSFRSDLILLALLDEVGHRWPAIDVDKGFLMRLSGGDQFAHRFLYLHPDRLAAVSVGAPGTSTFLEDEQEWTKGIEDLETVLDTTVDIDRIKETPIQLVVGEKDTVTHGNPAFWKG